MSKTWALGRRKAQKVPIFGGECAEFSYFIYFQSWGGAAKVYLFGSYSKGCARPDSDIDIAVVVPRVKGDYLSTAASLWRITMDVNTLIEPVLIEEVHPSPLYEDILQTGIAV